MRNQLHALFLIAIISSQFYSPITALEEGELHSSLNGKEITTSIEIKFWGFTPLELADVNFVSRFIQESYFPDSPEPNQYYTKAYSTYKGTYLYGIVNKIKYKFTYQSTNIFTDLKNELSFGVTSSALAGRYTFNGSSVDIPGVRLSETQLVAGLKPYLQSKSMYQIHVLNFEYLDEPENNRSHWIYNSPALNYLNGESDFRNAGIIEDRSIYFDPTAFVPRITGSHNNMSRWQDLSNELKKQYLVDSINDIIEQGIIGSPYSNPYGVPKLNEFAVHSSLIALVNQSLPSYSDIIRSVSSTYQLDIWSLYPFTENFKTKTQIIDINDLPKLRDYIYSNIVEENGSKYFIIDDSSANFFKNFIRNTKNGIYSKWPSGFFYLNLVWGFDEDIRVMYQRGDTLTPYDQEIVGMGVVDAFGKNGDGTTPSPTVLTNLGLHIGGKIMGLHAISEGVAKFLQGPMSTYFSQRIGYLTFNQFNIDQVMRKYAVIANLSVTGILRDYTEELTVKNYDYLPHDELSEPEVMRIAATELWQKGKYEDATALFIDAYIELLNAIKSVNAKISGVGNTFYWFLGIAILLSIVSILGSFELRKKREFVRNKNGVPLEWLRNDEE